MFRSKSFGLLCTRAHAGGLLYILRRAAERAALLRPLVRRVDRSLASYTNRRTRAFDLHHGTETFTRSSVSEYEVGDALDWDWLYGPVSPDFFEEIVKRLRLPAGHFSFLDVGAGKGMAIMLASQFSFRRLIAVEFAKELVAAGKENVRRYEASTRRRVDVEWVCQDFMTYELPDEPVLLFLNNPFPRDISERAVRHLRRWLEATPRDAIVVYRKAPGSVIELLEESDQLERLAWSPYWQAFSTVGHCGPSVPRSADRGRASAAASVT